MVDARDPRVRTGCLERIQARHPVFAELEESPVSGNRFMPSNLPTGRDRTTE
jgi:hypothetical protein